MSGAARRPIQPEDLLAIKTIADVQLSPDGARVAYVLTEIDAEKDENRSTIWVVPVAPAPALSRAEGAPAVGGEGRGPAQPVRPVQFTRGPKKDTAPRWSPDGTHLAFLSDRDGEHPQLYVMPAGGGEARKLTSLERGAGPAVWSPDGTKIVFAARALAETPPKDEEARKRWEQRPKVVTRAQYKADGQGYTFDAPSRLFLIALDALDGLDGAQEAEPRQLTHGEGEDRAPSWSPDGARIAFSRTRPGVADYNLSDIWVMDAGGANLRRLTETVGRATSPTWSPDGATIACYGTDAQEPGLGESLVRVWTVPAAGAPHNGAARRLTADYDRGAFLLMPPAVTPGPTWSPDGATLTFTAADAGNLHLVRVSVDDGTVRPVVAGERQLLSASAVAGAQRIAFCASTPDDPGDVYVCAWDGSEERRLTHVNQPLLDTILLPRVERRAFANPNGGTLDGWLMRPLRGEAGTSPAPAPLLVQIHGGPHSFAGNTFQHSAFYSYVLAARGWAVLALNPSGSGSYGKAFAHRLRGRWGEYDLPEQLAAVEALVAEGIADAGRLAVTGYSYGGYMTAWTIGQTRRFKAAVIGAPVTNLESFHGTSDIGLWFTPWEMDGDVFAQRETLRRLSPVQYVDRVTTPALVLHGEADDRCPIGQGEEFYIGLLAAGRVPTEFVRYPGGSHLFLGTGRPSHRLDYTRRLIDWVERHTR